MGGASSKKRPPRVINFYGIEGAGKSAMVDQLVHRKLTDFHSKSIRLEHLKFESEKHILNDFPGDKLGRELWNGHSSGADGQIFVVKIEGNMAEAKACFRKIIDDPDFKKDCPLAVVFNRFRGNNSDFNMWEVYDEWTAGKHMTWQHINVYDIDVSNYKSTKKPLRWIGDMLIVNSLVS